MITRDKIEVSEPNESGDVRVTLLMGIQGPPDRVDEFKTLIMQSLYRDVLAKLIRLRPLAHNATRLVNGIPPHPDAQRMVTELTTWQQELIELMNGAPCPSPEPTSDSPSKTVTPEATSQAPT